MSASPGSVPKVRLPPIQPFSVINSGYSKERPSLNIASKTNKSSGIDWNVDETPLRFSPVFQPTLKSQLTESYQARQKRGKRASIKITHLEKVPTRPPGQKFAVLPPIGGAKPVSQLPDKQTDVRAEGRVTQLDEKSRKENSKNTVERSPTSQEERSNLTRQGSSTTSSKTRFLIRQFSIGNLNRQEEYKIPDSISTAEKSKSNSVEGTNTEFTGMCEDINNDSDGSEHMIELSEALTYFLEWSKELREFLGSSRGSVRRNATCTALEPSLVHAVDVIRDMLLRQTMEELCMSW